MPSEEFVRKYTGQDIALHQLRLSQLAALDKKEQERERAEMARTTITINGVQHTSLEISTMKMPQLRDLFRAAYPDRRKMQRIAIINLNR